MQLLIDRQARDVLYEACGLDIEGVSDIKIEAPGCVDVRKLWQRLSVAGPLLDQIGWQQDADREIFEIALNVRRVRPFLRRHIRGVEDLFENSISTATGFDASQARPEEDGGPPLSAEKRAAELARLRVQVDADLDELATLKRLLEAIDPLSGDLETVP